MNSTSAGASAPRSRRRSARARCGASAARPASPARPSGSRAASVRQQPVFTPQVVTERDHRDPIAGPAGGEHAERFTLLRPLLFTIVYEILGSATESDDVLQDSYLRWADVDLATVRDTKSYLAQLVTRQALNALRASARRREDYIGPWLPEPLLLDDARRVGRCGAGRVGVDGDAGAAGDADARRAGGVRAARGVRLRATTKSPAAVGKSVATVRQMAHRAREHVQSRRKRFEPVDPTRTAQITERFMTAAATGDMDGLLSMLAPDATWTADSGGKASAARRPVVGAKKVASGPHGAVPVRPADAGRAVELVNCNNAPALVRLPRRPPRGRVPRRDHRRQDHATSTRCATRTSSSASTAPRQISR